MNKASTLALSSILVAGGFLAGRSLPGSAAATAPGARKVLYWVDPMHPAYRSDRPGTAPDCGMQLEPVFADGGPAPGAAAALRPAGTVTMGAELRQLQGVRVGTVERAPGAQGLRLLGRVVPDETRVYTVNAAMEGSLRALSGVTTGSFVRKDEWLGSFFSADIRTPLQAYITALDVQDQDPLARARNGVSVAAGTSASRSAQFSVERLRGMGMSSRQIEELRRTRDIPLTIDIRSPADGLVLARNASPGQKFEKGAEWFRIANLERVWIVADLLERDAALVKPGAKARVAFPGEPASLTGTVSAVPPWFDPASRTLKLRLEVENRGAALRPDMFVDVELAGERPAATTVPVDALVDAGLRKTVFVERGEGTYEPRRVETGWRSGDRVEIVRGLDPGERIVVSGTFLVDSESQLRSAAAGVHGAAATDPVCGMEVDEARARAAGNVVEHDGKRWSFCSETCRTRFQATPERWATGGAGAEPGRDAVTARSVREGGR
ncbi:efflux RND transporter periplasmic adaptor subunit [Anaeromyxobacter oryzae]|uniref:RND transporter n=1 Tax=Anaeromyxobacter oryzae TaxID=2918170 RepID=A0ABN6N2G5_9BACT|nr:efflux RND transporter periplasmic adaptor subunit [Anaeromyxobacter oryzae]BDG06104.1 RND transporter [Anaeromyxobacter oryzae]